jgi:hypothetical protein
VNYNNSCGFKSSSLKNCFGPDKRLARKTKKSGFRQDPLVILTYFVLFGVLISGFTSFGL